MSQPDETIRDAKNISIPKYLIMTVLTIFSIGPQYFLNLSYTLNQVVIQNGLHLTTGDMRMPSIFSNLAFALGVPLGRVLSRRFGIRNSYLAFIFVFLYGSLIDAFSAGLISLIVGRVIQGLSAGMLFLTILPVKLVSFPNKFRHLFLFFVITGLFGASALGAVFGSLSLSADTWRWVFILNICSPILCLVIGFLTLPKQASAQRVNHSIDKTGVFLLSLLMIVLAVPFIHLQESGFHSLYVWPFFLAAFILLGLFIMTDLRAEHPLVPFHSLWTAKSVSGTIMAVVSHIALIVALAGDIHQASKRSVSLHFIRNFAGAAAAPVLGWFASMKNTVHYETIRGDISPLILKKRNYTTSKKAIRWILKLTEILMRRLKVKWRRSLMRRIRYFQCCPK